MNARTRRTAALIIPLLLAALLLSGCGSLAEEAVKKAVETSTGVTVDEKGDGIKVKTSEGELEVGGEGAELPDGFPKDVPVYDGKIASASKFKDGKITSYIVNLTFTGSAKDVGAFYKREMAGWQVVSSSEFGGNIMNTYQKGDTSVSVLTTKQEEKNLLSLTVQQGVR